MKHKKHGNQIQLSSGVKRKRRGNPNWGKPPSQYTPVIATKWEKLLKSIHLTEYDTAAITRSPSVRAFVHKHKNNSYVLEWVLKSMGCTVEISGEFEVYD